MGIKEILVVTRWRRVVWWRLLAQTQLKVSKLLLKLSIALRRGSTQDFISSLLVGCPSSKFLRGFCSSFETWRSLALANVGSPSCLLLRLRRLRLVFSSYTSTTNATQRLIVTYTDLTTDWRKLLLLVVILRVVLILATHWIIDAGLSKLAFVSF